MFHNKNYDFVGKKKMVATITICIIAVCALFLLIRGITLDIKFTGGSIIKYNYSQADKSEEVSETDIDADVTATDVSAADVLGAVDEITASDVSAADLIAPSAATVEPEVEEEYPLSDPMSIDIVPNTSVEIDKDEVKDVAVKMLNGDVSVSLSSRINTDGSSSKSVSIKLADKRSVGKNAGGEIAKALERKYPNVKFTLSSVNSVDPVMGKEFFFKCLIAIAVAGLFMILYVAFRFRKIGGFSAGLMAIVAVINDCFVVFTTFVVFGFPIDDNFVAAILTIIGYTLNSTIVIYDRVRENRKKLGPKVDVATLVNTSINETLARTIYTNLTFVFAVGAVVIVALIFGISSIISFAVPMLFGIISGCYSSLFIANILWVMWQQRKARKIAAKKIAAKN